MFCIICLYALVYFVIVVEKKNVKSGCKLNLDPRNGRLNFPNKSAKI
jgi:hypothetical protein